MKTTLLLTMALNLTLGAFAQGTLNIGNNFPGIFRAPIYGPPDWNAIESLNGQSPLGLPSGSTVYAGPLLQGTGFNFAVYYGAATAVDLTLLVTRTFRTGSAAGLINSLPGFSLPGIAAGERARLEVRVWDNDGGTITSWESAYRRGRSGLFLSQPLGGGIMFPFPPK